VIWAFTIITLWVAFAKYYEILVANMKFVILWIFIIISLYIAIFKRKEFKQYIKDKNAEIDEKIAESNKNKQ
jgi:hypothetical protein